MPSTYRDPMTGEVKFKNPANTVINETTGQTADTLTPTPKPFNTAQNLSIGLSQGQVTDQSQIDAGLPEFTPTEDFNIDIPETGVPSEALASNASTSSIVSKQNTAQTAYNDYLSQQQTLQDEILALSQPSEELTNALADLDKVREDRERLLDFSEDRTVDIGTIRGEQDQINRSFSRREQTAINRANLLLNQQAQRISATEKALQFNQQNLDTVLKLHEMTSPEIVGQEIDPVTGDVIAFTQNSDGSISSQTIGRISVPDPEKETVGIITNAATGQKILVSLKDGVMISEPIEGSTGLAPRSGGVTTGGGFGSSNPDASFIENLGATRGGRLLTQGEAEPFTKGFLVLDQLGALSDTILDKDTGPIIGILADNNPYDVKASLINAQLQAIVPNLARGVYGEVGVLTDTDIENYKKTLPNLRSTEDVGRAVLGMTLRVVQSSMKRQLEVMMASGRDVSGFAGLYQELENAAGAIEDSLATGGDVVDADTAGQEADEIFGAGKDGGNSSFLNQVGSFFTSLFR